jgi:hypothetical protein
MTREGCRLSAHRWHLKEGAPERGLPQHPDLALPAGPCSLQLLLDCWLTGCLQVG